MARIQARIFRFQLGNLGDVKSVGEGVLEARFHFGAGYRLYFGQDGGQLVVLLIGGDKSSQTKDIDKAKVFWKDFKESKNA
jgi:putative addiction module killer protein